MQIKFDLAHNPEKPTLVLAKKNGEIIGGIKASDYEFKDETLSPSEIKFLVSKYHDGIMTPFWDKIVNFRLVRCVEWDVWFEITVDIDEEENSTKTVIGKRLGPAELSQINIYGLEINTESDIERDDYIAPTIFYHPTNKSISLLDRMLDKAPHYKITHVDSTIANIQRTFSFNGKSIYDAFQEVAQEIGCIFIFPSNSDSKGKIQRTIEVYDFEGHCFDCGNRGEFTLFCPKCGSKNISEGYGEDTTIFITSDELTDSLNLTTETNSVKNCFKLEAGDELMTATVINCTPNNSAYYWDFSNLTQEDMSTELVTKLSDYNHAYQFYENEVEIVLEHAEKFSELIDKYKRYNPNLENIDGKLCGYASLMDAYYKAIDLKMYLKSGLMPSVQIQNTSAYIESKKLTSTTLSPVSLANIDSISEFTATNAVISIAKVLVDSRYGIKVKSKNLNKSLADVVWSGVLTVTSYSDDEDYFDTNELEVHFDTNYSAFIKKKIDIVLSNQEVPDIDITSLFKKDTALFAEELHKYGLKPLGAILDSCAACINVMIEHSISSQDLLENDLSSLYDSLYLPYIEKQKQIEDEIKVREQEIGDIAGLRDSEGLLLEDGMQTEIERYISDIHEKLDLRKNLGDELWNEFCLFRREDIYSNSNYVSDGLNNAEIIRNALRFIESAKLEMSMASKEKHSIKTTLVNLLVNERFEPILKYFKLGNWMRVLIDDSVYKLRLISYSINFNDLNHVDVDFSDAVNIKSPTFSLREAFSQIRSIGTSYNSVKRQAEQGEKTNTEFNDFKESGLVASAVPIINSAKNQTQTWDKSGMLFREYDPIVNDYIPEQLKIINSTIAITDDKWNSTKTALGKFYYYDPKSKIVKQGFGVNGSAIVGQLFLGETLGLYNESGNLSFDEDGLIVTNGKNTITIDPNSDSIFNISDTDRRLFAFDEDGDLNIVGNLTAKSLTLDEGVYISSGHVDGLSSVALSGEYDDLNGLPILHTVAFSGNYSELNGAPVLSVVAISGEYSDLIGKPDIDSMLAEIATLKEELTALNDVITDLTQRVSSLESES